MEELGYYHRRLEVPSKMVHVCTCRNIIIITCTLYIHGQYLHMYTVPHCMCTQQIPYSRVIRRMRLYLHRKRICAYKRPAPNKEQRLNSSTSTCDVHAYSASPMQTTPYIITI